MIVLFFKFILDLRYLCVIEVVLLCIVYSIIQINFNVTDYLNMIRRHIFTHGFFFRLVTAV